MANTGGPLFDGRADIAMENAMDDIEHAVAEAGEEQVRAYLGERVKHPTGRYESVITEHPDAGGDAEISDQGIVYGPWLEGIGSRNRTTRFKGYATFRRVTQALDKRAEGLTEVALIKHVKEIS